MTLADQVSALVPAATFGRRGTCRIEDDGTGPRVAFWDPSLGTQPTADQLAAAVVRAPKLAAIEARTADLLAAGFVYAGKAFTLDPATQSTWTNLMLAAAQLAYPVSVGALDGTTAALASPSDVQAFYATGLARGRAIVEGGAQLKAAVTASTTQADVDAVADSRT